MFFYVYYGINQEIAELQTIVAAYRLRISILDNIINTQQNSIVHHDFVQLDSNFEDGTMLNDCDSGSTFTLLNRNLAYLKRCTHRFFKAQALDTLLAHIDHSLWERYSGVDNSFKKNRVVRRIKKGSRVKTVDRVLQTPNEKAPLQWPIQVDKFWLSSLYGPRRKRDGSFGFHYGIDMAAIKGTPVMAAASGTVVQAQYAGGWGNSVVIKHLNHLTTRYAHLHEVLVRPGQKVFAGMIIGKVGETGYIRKKTNDGSHLHFELYKYNTRINPLTLLPKML
ncbi:M23 family metallopeptidase [Candidatus Dependentiae bacterium]|nr:MAG: M23 family metallopeptidase [Candidatus Dependentiae bacterium]